MIEEIIEEIKNVVSSMIKPLRNRVYTMITRAVIETVNDTDGMQLVKVNLLAGEARDGVERFQNFGFSSHPPDSSECVAVSIGGNRDHLIIIVADDRDSRITGLIKGESVQYNDKGEFWKIKTDGTIEGKVKKLEIKNDNEEFMDLLIQFMNEVEIGETNTLLGPLRKNNHLLIKAIKDKMATFKV